MRSTVLQVTGHNWKFLLIRG